MEQIGRHLDSLTGSIGAEDMLVYYPTASELRLMPWYESRIGKIALYFPKTGRSSLSFYRARSLRRENFVRGRMGIWEPRDTGEAYREGVPTIAIVPGLVFSKGMGRIGYGGGYYDGFLATHPTVIKLGVCYEFQLFENMDGVNPEKDILPQHDRDVPMDYVITEKNIYFGKDKDGHL